MAIDFAPTQSKTFFVGREAQLHNFVQILDDTRPEWIVHVPGEGGVGKTRLLEEFRKQAQQIPHALCAAELIDFYNAAYQTQFGLLQEITHQLGTERFSRFAEERDAFNRLLTPDLDPGERHAHVGDVMAAFLQDYAELLRQEYRIVLLFDTCEEMRSVESFMLGMLLPQLRALEERLYQEKIQDELTDFRAPPTDFRSQTTVVLAGRKFLEFSAVPEPQVLLMELPALAQDQVLGFFRLGGMPESAITDEESLQLYARTGGRPLYVALSFDWLSNQIGTVAELLSLKEPFGQTLVEWLLRLENPERNAILYTALAWRRMEPGLLARLLNLESEAQAQQLIEDLGRFSFVKYRPPHDTFRGAFQLHDEMRELVNKYVWPQEGKLTEAKLLRVVADWYAERIGDPALLEGQALTQSDETRSLLAEWLFYNAILDLDHAFELYEKIFRRASHYLDLAAADLYNQEMRRFRDAATPAQQDDLDFREALVAFRREEFDLASGIWHSLLRRRDLNPTVRATTLMLLVELDGDTNRHDEALEHAAEAEGIYRGLIAAAEDDEQRSSLRSGESQLYNNRGYVYRRKGDYPNALKYYELALEYKDRPKNTARTLNNMGYVYLLQGRPAEAKTHVGRALQMRREFSPKIPYELGLGLNTMGMIMEQTGRLKEAADLYQGALREFQAARSERGEALVLLNLGRMRRVTNDFSSAQEYLQKACRVFQDKTDNTNLVLALNELSAVYRERGRQHGNAEDWVQSERYLQQSLKLSQEIENVPRIVETHEDLAALHYFWAASLAKRQDPEDAAEHQRQAREYAQEVEARARPNKMLYRLAKNEKLLGDLDYLEDKYDTAFEHYFEACHLMAQAPTELLRPARWTQHRYDEMVDRLQEQLQGLPKADETRYYAHETMKRLDGLDSVEQEQLSSLRHFLVLTLEIADKGYAA